jgi:hypothetical protein
MRTRVAVAAALLVGAAAGAWWVAGARDVEPTEERLVAAAARLKARYPATFVGFRPLSAADLASVPAPERGGVALGAPRGTVLGARPTFAWAPVAGAGRYRVRVRGADGKVVLETETTATAVDFPAAGAPLADGAAFVWRVVAAGASGEAEGSAAFTVASAGEKARLAEGLRAIDAEVHPRLRPVVAAQWAVRMGMAAEARRLLDAAPADVSAVVRATREHVARLLGEAATRPPL